MDSHIRLFNFIAQAYRKFYGMQRRMFQPIVAANAKKIGADQGDSFLDVGCGTGALVSVLSEAGFKAEGVDAAPKMVAAARKAGWKCELGDIRNGLPYPDGSFDFVISSYVAHGINSAFRETLFREARRIARKAVIIHDYRGRQSWTTELIERLEGGDYFAFVNFAEKEMANFFGSLEIIDVAPANAWYVGR
ncbi:MAG: class I SAM-dependent methyltransferase [Treponemataceae bacterium]